MVNRIRALMMAAMMAWAGSHAWGVDRHWNTGTGAWGTAANWSPAAVPTASDIVYLDHLVNGVRGVVNFSGTGFANPISISMKSLNELNIQSFSSLTVGGDILVGYDDSVGFLNMRSSSPGIVFFGSQLTVGNTLRLGYGGGFGTVNQNDGTITVNQMVRVGDRHNVSPIFPGTGRYNLSGVGVLNAARLEIGYGGDSSQYACEGEFNLSGNARLNISLGAQIPDPKIGGGGSPGTFNQSGGHLNSPNRIIDFAPGGGSGIYNFSGGTTSLAGVHFSNSSGTINYNSGSVLSLGQLQMTGGGNVMLASGGGKILRDTVLWVASNSAVIDVNDNSMITLSVLTALNGQSLPTLLQRGYANGAWTGNGITSTAARNDPAHRTALGYAEAAQFLPLEQSAYNYQGQSVPGNALIVKYTYYGDANLDGQVDISDLAKLATAWQTSGAWIDGDFNYNGFVDISDLALLATNWQAGVGAPLSMSFEQALASVGLGGVAVPEPACGLALPAAFLGFLSCRRSARLI